MIVEEEMNIRQHGKKATKKNAIYQKMLYTLKDGEYMFSIYLTFKVSISECSVNDDLIIIRFCNRKWISLYDNLRTELIQLVHDSILREYPEHEDIYAILAWKYFWPNMAKDIHKFTDNYDSYGANKAGRRQRQGLLKSLSVSNHIGWNISIDFITNLLNSDDYINMIVITDHLSKKVIADGLEDIMSVIIAKWFLGGYFPHHSLPYIIVSNHGTQFISDFWTGICMKLKIKRRLSIVYSPETNGSIEHMNQEMKNYLRKYMSFAQDDGLNWLDIATKTINIRDFSSTKMSPFFMRHNGYLDMMDMELESNDIQRSSIVNTNHTLYKLQDICEGI